MTNREKVIKGLEQFRADFRSFCGNHADWERFDAGLSMLKEQESISCGEKIKAGDVVLDFYECGYCKNAIRKPWRYCPFCGKAVKWE